MIRKLMLAVVILTMAAVPIPALARDGGHGFNGGPRFHGGHEFRHEFRGGHERFERFHRHFFGYGFYPYPYYPYPYYPYYGTPYYFPRR
jgi:hypothetical protein